MLDVENSYALRREVMLGELTLSTRERIELLSCESAVDGGLFAN